MNGLLVFYLVGVLASFYIGYKTLKEVGEEGITTEEILLLIFLSIWSWLTVIMFGAGKFLKGCKEDAKKIFNQYDDDLDIPELDIDDEDELDIDDEDELDIDDDQDELDNKELRGKADRQERFKL